jgi:hypothetical protein
MDVRGVGDGGTRRVRNYRLNGSVRSRLVGKMKKKHRLVDELMGEDLSRGLSAQSCMVKKAEAKLLGESFAENWVPGFSSFPCPCHIAW